MKEIDTADSPVVWPAWCYSGNITTDSLKQSTTTTATAATTRVGVKTSPRRPAVSATAAAGTTTSATLSTFLTSLSTSAASTSSSSSSSSSSASSTSSNCSTEIVANNNSNNNKHKHNNSNISDIVTNKSQTKRKSNSSTIKALRHTAQLTATLTPTLTPNSAESFADETHTGNKTITTATSADSNKALTALLQQSTQRQRNKNNCRSPTSVSAVEKMLSERSLLLSGFNAIENAKRLCDPIAAAAATASAATVATTTTTSPNSTAAGTADLYLEKLKNEKLSPRMTAAQIDWLKDAIMESTSGSNNNKNSSNSNNNINSNSTLNNNSSSLRLQNIVSANVSNHNNAHQYNQHHHQQQQQQQQQQHQHLSSNNVKRERLSPGTNGELQSSLSRSRSATPSSFRGTSPHAALQNAPSESMMPVHNLSANLLNSIQQAASAGRHANAPAVPTLPTDFSTRNYSEFMRSLAAKYNNTNPNDSSTTRRNTFFDSSASSTPSSSNKIPIVANKPPACASVNKETTAPPPLLSPADTATNNLKSQSQHQTQMAAAAAASVSPFMTSFLSSLPFGQGVFPSLIDMSSTQALITLARAAKEAEIQNILRSAQNPKRPASSASSSPRPSLTAALQQAAQFVAPTLFYSTQLQQQSQHASRQSSPLQARLGTNSATAVSHEKSVISSASTPLDLSSQPPAAKRFKVESTLSSDSNEENTRLHEPSSRIVTSSRAATPLQKFHPLVEPTTNLVSVTPTSQAANLANSTPTSLNVGSLRQCQAQSDEVNAWTVDDVCAFVGAIDICAEYMQKFRDQCIDGSGLPLLTEDHLMNSLGMKLGPALKLRSMLAKKLGGPCPCVSCVAQAQMLAAQALQTGSVTTTASLAVAATTAIPSTTTTHTAAQATGSSATTAATTLTAGSVGLVGIGNGPHGQQHQHQRGATITITTTTAAESSTTSTTSATATAAGNIDGSSSTSSLTAKNNNNNNKSSNSSSNINTHNNNGSENSSNQSNNNNNNNSSSSTNVVNNSSANNDCCNNNNNNNNTNMTLQRPGSADSGS